MSADPHPGALPMVLLWLVVLFGVIALFQMRDRLRHLEDTIKELRHTIDRLSKRVDEGAPAQPLKSYQPPAVRPQPAAPPPATPRAQIPEVPVVARHVPPPAVAAHSIEKPVATATSPSTTSFSPPPPTPPPTVPPRGPRPSTPEPAGPKRSFDWEALIGVKFFAIVASLALFLAGGFFVSYSMDHGWLTPSFQFAIGIVAGVACLVIGELKESRRYPWTGDALDASGISILYVVFFAAFARWHLVGPTGAFVLFILATVVAVLLSIRRASLLIALLGLLGGFASPALVATGQDNPIGLFGYLLLLNAGLAWVAYKKRWPLLTAISLGITTIYQWGWVSKFLTTGKLPLAAAIFLIFPVMTFVGLSLIRPAADDRSW